MKRRIGLVVVVCVVTVWSGILQAALEVPFTVVEPIGAERSLEVVSGGIPFPEGVYHDPSLFRLYEGKQEVPVQVSPIVKYPDGSLHWALVSFPVTLRANETKTFVLREGKGNANLKNPVVVTEQGSQVEVSNGLVSFSINKDAFNGFESVAYKGKRVFTPPKQGLVANGKGGPGKLTHFEYRYKGPVRVTLYLKGTYGAESAPTWAMAVTLHAGEPKIRLEHSLRNAAKNAPKRLSVADPKICFGLAGDLQAEANSGTSGKGAFGWQAFRGDTAVLVFLRHAGFRCQGVYRVDKGGGELAIHLGDRQDGSSELEYGAHKATEVDLVFGNAFRPEALSEPLHALAPCAAYAAHDGMGVGKYFGSLADETATYKAQGWKNADNPKKMPNEKPNPFLYRGSIGDVHFRSECDHLQGMVFGYIRTGRIGFLDEARSWARYWRTYFVYRSDEWEYGREGSYKTPKWGTSSHPRVCTEGCHNYVCGLFNYALITGEIDALEAAFDGAEFCNLSWTGQYSNAKPGQSFSVYGTRAYARNFVIIARAYEVARTEQWRAALRHYVALGLKTPARDPRGFTTSTGRGRAARAKKEAERTGPAALALLEKEKTEVTPNTCRHPLYGEWAPSILASWPESMENWAMMTAYETLSASKDPSDQLMAEDVLDYVIAQAYCMADYGFHPVQKAVYPYLTLDFPVPDFIPMYNGGEWDTLNPKKMMDSWYTKWVPNVLVNGYRLTGDRRLRNLSMEVLWWGLSRDYVAPPRVPEGEAPPYARVEKNTKGDWMTPTCKVFGLIAFPKKEDSPPHAITDLKAMAKGNSEVQLTWTSPADRGGGAVTRYQVKWSEKPLVDRLKPGDEYRSHFRNGALNVTFWNMASNVTGEPLPHPPGQKQTTILSVPPKKVLYFGIRSFDDSHNLSPLSNVAELHREAQ